MHYYRGPYCFKKSQNIWSSRNEDFSITIYNVINNRYLPPGKWGKWCWQYSQRHMLFPLPQDKMEGELAAMIQLPSFLKLITLF